MKKQAMDRCLGLAAVLALAGSGVLAAAQGAGAAQQGRAGHTVTGRVLAAADTQAATGNTQTAASSDQTGEDRGLIGGVAKKAGELVEKAADAVRKKKDDNVVNDLLGQHDNYTFVVQAPSEFASSIRSSTLVGRWQKRKDYDPVQFDGLVARLHDEVLAIVQAEGYYEPEITVTSKAPSEVKVVLKPGRRTRVGSLDIQVEGEATQNRALRNIKQKFGMAVGAPFVSDDWQSGKSALLDAMKREGYLRARIARSSAQINAHAAEAKLTVVVDSGNRLAFGPLEIRGLSRYPARIIEDLRTFRQGDAYTEVALQRFQKRLRDAGYFSAASALPDLIALQEDTNLQSVPITVVVEEMQRHRMVYGLGYSTDDGVRGQVGWQDRNLFGLQMESSVVLSQRRQRAFANLRTPFDANNRYFGFGGRLERESESDVDTFKSNVYAGYGHREDTIDAFTSLQLQQEETHFHNPTRHNGIKALVLGKAWTLQRFDSDLNPTRGYGVKFEISAASRKVVSDATFTRFYTSMVGLRPLPSRSIWRNGTLVGRIEFGAVNSHSIQNIPSDNLFRAGGIGSLRGYGYRSLGLNVNNSIVGERFLAIGSLEYQHRLTDMVSLGVFYDYGNVTNAWRDIDPVSGYGAGVQLRTPVGPVKLDIAYGQAIHRYRLHFSIGFTF